MNARHPPALPPRLVLEGSGRSENQHFLALTRNTSFTVETISSSTAPPLWKSGPTSNPLVSVTI